MKRQLFSLLFLIACLSNGMMLTAQTITLTFTGRTFEADYIPLDSVTIFSYEGNWQETIYFTDTVFVMNPAVGITTYDSIPSAELKVFPNPTDGSAVARLYLPQGGSTTLTLSDLSGKILQKWSGRVEKGGHIFNISLSNTHVCLLTAKTSSATLTEKIINTGDAGQNAIKYVGSIPKEVDKKQGKGQSTHPYSLYGYFICTGYTTFNGKVYQKSLDYIALEDTLFTFYFNVITSYGKKTCPGVETVTDFDGNEYPTVQIGTQCWLQKNLQTTHYDNGEEIPYSTDVSHTQAYRHYPGLDSNYVDLYGYLYNWNAVTNAGAGNGNPQVQGVCPEGWHIPSMKEWDELFGYLASQPAMICQGDTQNVAKAIAAKSGWAESEADCAIGNQVSANNVSGFNALPAGIFVGKFDFFGKVARFWSSSVGLAQGKCDVYMDWDDAIVKKSEQEPAVVGFSVRCLKNE